MKTRLIGLIFALAACLAVAFPATALAANNVHNVTLNKWYDTLSAATAAATDGNVIEVHNSFTEKATVKIQKQNLTIRAASGKNPTISWTSTDEVAVTGATSYHCIVIYTSVNTSTTFGGGSGVLTFDASKASDSDNKGKRARVMAHCGSGTLNIMDGVVLTGGNPGGGSYSDGKQSGPRPSWSGEVTGEVGFGAGIFMRYGTLNMTGGVIKDNYSLWGATTDHNYVGGGGGVYLYNDTEMLMSGGTITHNAAGSGGGAGILVGYYSKLTVSGGTISENKCGFASGGGIGVRTNSEVKITGGLIKENVAEGHGGGLFARGDSIPLEITGGTFEGNVAGSYGGGVLFWTVGDDVTKNTVVIGGDARIINNKALDGGGVSVGREVLHGKPIGNKAKLVIQGSPVISGNTASRNGGGIHMQSDEFSDAVNTVNISGGTISGNEAADGAGIYVPGGTVTVTGGSFTENKASDRGAGIFTGGGTMTISNAVFSKNTASSFGGGAYVVGGSVVLNSGTFSENEAESGGAVYITKVGTTRESNLTMNAGAFSKNAAADAGGAVYIEGGNVDVRHGYFTGNSAADGGAVYMAGDTSTSLIMESGTMSGNTASDDGGAVFATGGTIKIGLEACKGEDEAALAACTHHTAKGEGRHHPVINGNEAKDCGGGIAIGKNGVVHFYCGEATDNSVLYKGVGKNVFMDGGEFNLYDGATVGAPRDPDLVIVGGKLNNKCEVENYVTLNYYMSNGSMETGMVGLAQYEEVMNLPDGEYFWPEYAEDNNLAFIGWTAQGAASGNQSNEFVRHKEQYLNSGSPVQIIDAEPGVQPEDMDQTDRNTAKVFDGDSTDKVMHLYALWAPVTNPITYVDNISWDVVSGATLPASYTFSRESNVVEVESLPKPGYEVKGWWIYQDESQNANWSDDADMDYEPDPDGTVGNYSNLNLEGLVYQEVDADGTLQLEAGNANFGKITLVANYVPAYADLVVSKDGWNTVDENQTFLLRIVGTPYAQASQPEAFETIDVTVSVKGNGSVKIEHLPLGDYEVTELEDWSWRYWNGEEFKSQNVVLNQSEMIGEAPFANTRPNIYWLSGDSWCRNLFAGSAIDKTASVA